jgi:hypothetical protein
MIFEPLVTDVADVAFDLALALWILFRDNGVPRATVQVMHHIVKL